MRQFRDVLRTFQPDLVHVRMFWIQLSPAILPVLQHVPALLHIVNYNLICPIDAKILPDGAPCRVRAGLACRQQGCMPMIGVARWLVQTSYWRR